MCVCECVCVCVCVCVFAGARARAHGLSHRNCFDFVLVCDTMEEFVAEANSLLAHLKINFGAAIGGDDSTPGYLHISVNRNRVVDLAMVSSEDMASWHLTYGAPPLLHTLRGSPALAVMPFVQLHDRVLATSSGDVLLASRCFPLGFDVKGVPGWRVEKDRRQLQRIQIVQRLEAAGGAH